jgi:ribosome assembly protein YihI (activator of Der GTPase)
LGERRLAILEEEKKLAEELATLQAGEQTAETQKTIADDLARQLKLKEELVLIDKS